MLAKWKGFFFFHPFTLLSFGNNDLELITLHGWHVLGSALGIPLPTFINVLENHAYIAGYLGNTIVPLFLNFNKAAISFLFYSLLSLQDQGVSLWD